MNKETMKKHYERTPKETLINILISSREQVEKLQKRNKERKQEIERLNNNKKEALEFIDRYLSLNLDEFNASSLLKKLREILTRGDDYPKEE